MKLPPTGGHIFESCRAYINYKEKHPEFIDKFWEENTKHWWDRL